MKKIITLAAFLFMAFTSGAFAQYQKGDISVNAGLSLGTFGYGYGFYGSSSGFLPVTANLEYSINDRFAVGPYVGIYSRTYQYLTYKDRFTAFSFGGRGTFHASGFLNELFNWNINEEKLDLYATVILGIESRSWSWDDEYDVDRLYDNEAYLEFGPLVGIRYNFNPSFGAFFETGGGTFGLATIGFTAKF